MGRLLKLICCTVALTAGVGAALAAAAPTRRASHMTICPLESSAATTTPCCGPPIVTAASAALACCGTPQAIACPVGLTLSSSSNPSVAGQKVTLTGSWTGGSAGQTVELWQELPGAKAFAKVADAKTGSLGDFQFVRNGVETNRQWYVSVGSTHSATIEQRVRAKVTVSASATKVHGHVFPNHAGDRVSIEKAAAHGWTVVARARLSHASRYSVKAPACNVRVVLGGDRQNIRSIGYRVCSGY